MAKRLTVNSDGDIWVFEEGKTARFTPRGGTRPELADFKVLEITTDPQTLITTDLRGLSRYDWQGPVIFWAGEYKVAEV